MCEALSLMLSIVGREEKRREEMPTWCIFAHVFWGSVSGYIYVYNCYIVWMDQHS
jgi:hypothetical protein